MPASIPSLVAIAPSGKTAFGRRAIPTNGGNQKSRRCAQAGSWEEQPFAGARLRAMARGIDRQQAGSYEEQPFTGARLRAMAGGMIASRLAPTKSSLLRERACARWFVASIARKERAGAARRLAPTKSSLSVGARLRAMVRGIDARKERAGAARRLAPAKSSLLQEVACARSWCRREAGAHATRRRR
jgi:hypothetical protein